MWEFPKIRGTLFWGPYSKDPMMIGDQIRVPLFSETPMCVFLFRKGPRNAETVRARRSLNPETHPP